MVVEESEYKKTSEIYLRLADIIFGVIIAASFISFREDLIPFDFSFRNMMLLVSYLIVVLSWVGYHKAVAEKPHKGWTRFAIDLVLLFLYFYLIFTENVEEFLLVTIGMFFLYLLWVAKRKFEYPPKPGHESRLESAKIYRSLAAFIISTIMYNLYVIYVPTNPTWIFYDAEVIDWLAIISVLILNVVYRIVLPLFFKK